jgi:hypothetical protein
LLNAYRTDLPRKVDFVDEVESWEIKLALVDAKPERLFETLHATNRPFLTFIHHKLFIVFPLQKLMKSQGTDSF